jgi:outer membrane protein with beta-barrel domain
MGIYQEVTKVKLIGRTIPFLFFLLSGVSLACAQSVGFNMGFGTAQVKTNGAGIESLNSRNALGSCTPSVFDPNCLGTPGLRGFFLGFGGDVMFSKHVGFGGEYTFQPARGDYGPLEYRQHFYDFNAIYAPINEKKFALKLQGGIGGTVTSFTLSQNACVGTAVCVSSDQSIGNAHHFQAHAAVGLDFYLTEHFYVRPQFDVRYIPNFTDQFGSNWVPAWMLWIGFGTRY